MAKTSVVVRQKKRELTVARFAKKRAELDALIKNPKTPIKIYWEAQKKRQSLPRDASPVRLRNRCQQTGRPRGVYRMFGLSRSVLRLKAMHGELPGIKKSSW